jgi:hypothetical protein
MLSWVEAGMEPAPQPGGFCAWKGMSGETYRLEIQNLRTFILKGADIYLITLNDTVLWVGCGLDLVAEPSSRLRFRKALARADGVFRLARPEADEKRLTIMADLEGAVPAPRSQAA